MMTISLKIADNIVMRMDEGMEKYNYTTRSEFIRDAIREKLESLEKRKFESELRDYLHVTPKNSEVAKSPQETLQELEKAKKDIFLELEHKFGELREHLR
jgi:metal-responsive CopG/Arc/MetJ family transcriptional regulator